MACFEVSGVDPVGVFDVAVVGFACRWCGRGRIVAVLGEVGDDGCPPLAVFVFDNKVGGIRVGAVDVFSTER